MEQKTREEVAVRSRRQRMKAGVQWRRGVVVSIPYNNPIESNFKKKMYYLMVPRTNGMVGRENTTPGISPAGAYARTVCPKERLLE